MQNNNHSVVFLPWINIDKELTYSNVKLVPWPSLIKKYVCDEKLLEQLNRIFSSYQQKILHNKSGLTIASIENGIISPENADRLNEIYEAIKVFAFCSISKNQYFQSHLIYVNASCYELVSQRFVGGDYGLSFFSYKKDGSSSDGGYRYEDIKILAPTWVRQCHKFEIDYALLQSLEKCLLTNKKLYTRIFNGIQWFLLSFTDNPIISKELEIACLQISFEQLDQSKINTKTFYELFDYNIVPSPTNYSNPKGDWYYEFRKYRDKIFHGSLKKKQGKWDIYTHIFIASVVFVSSVKRILHKHALYNLSSEDKAMESALDIWMNDPEPDSWPELVMNKQREQIKPWEFD